MGVKDLVVLDDIRQTIKRLEAENNWGFTFKIDAGTWETAIEFTAIGYNHPPKSKSWKEVKDSENEIKCPDLLDFKNRIILEYEEESGNRKPGASLAKKGHGHEGDLSTKKDSGRDQLYRIGGFRLFKVWQSEYKKLKSNGSYEWESNKKQKIFELKLFHFLANCYCNRKIKKE